MAAFKYPDSYRKQIFDYAQNEARKVVYPPGPRGMVKRVQRDLLTAINNRSARLNLINLVSQRSVSPIKDQYKAARILETLISHRCRQRWNFVPEIHLFAVPDISDIPHHVLMTREEGHFQFDENWLHKCAWSGLTHHSDMIVLGWTRRTYDQSEKYPFFVRAITFDDFDGPRDKLINAQADSRGMYPLLWPMR